MTTGSRRAAVIVNPAKVDVARLRSAVAVEEERGGWQPSRWFETTVDEPGRLAAATALKDEPALVVVAGGDGTVRTVAEELLPAEVPLALIPAGTGNLLARNLGLMAGVEAARAHRLHRIAAHHRRGVRGARARAASRRRLGRSW